MKKKNLRQILIPAFIITACIPITIFTVISQARLKKSTLDNMNNQAEADLQKANQSLNLLILWRQMPIICEVNFHISVTEIRVWTGFSWYWQIEKESFMTGFLLLR